MAHEDDYITLLERNNERLREVLREALNQTGCDGDLCNYRWHEKARILLGNDTHSETHDIQLWAELIFDVEGRAHLICHTKDEDFTTTKRAFEKFIDILQAQIAGERKCPFYAETATPPQ